MDVVFLVGRVLFGMIFVLSGLSVHFKRESVEYARGYRAPAPELLVPLSGVVIIVAGLSVILGVWADLGALTLIAFLVPIAFIMHAFWREADEQMQGIQMAQFLKASRWSAAPWSSSTPTTRARTSRCRSPTPCSTPGSPPPSSAACPRWLGFTDFEGVLEHLSRPRRPYDQRNHPRTHSVGGESSVARTTA
jgi:putative oxidoreductase